MTRPATSPLDRKLLAVLRSLLGPVPIALVLRDTENLPDTDAPIVGTVRIPDRSTLLSMVVNPEVGFGDAYSSGRIEMDGDLVRSLECVYQSSPRIRNWYTAPALEVAGLGASQHPAWLVAQHSSPLRSLQRFLPALAR